MTAVPEMASVVIDCSEPQVLADFYAALLGVEVAAKFPGFIWLRPQRKGGYSLAFQQVPDPTPGKNKVHIDLHIDDLTGMSDRVEELGGGLLDQHSLPGFVWNVYTDPEGNQFCAGHEA